jgi:hypothetical protein
VVSNTGNSFASFLLGQLGPFAIDAQPETLKPRATVAEFFFQDDVRAADRLTLNLGLRYTLNFPSTVAGNHGAVLNLVTQRLDSSVPTAYRGPRVILKKPISPHGSAWHTD